MCQRDFYFYINKQKGTETVVKIQQDRLHHSSTSVLRSLLQKYITAVVWAGDAYSAAVLILLQQNILMIFFFLPQGFMNNPGKVSLPEI